MKTGIEQIAEELTKQINNTTLHYEDCKNKELLFGALSYLNAAIYGESVGNEDWPFTQINWQYEGYIESLKKAGAFIAAELDRLQKS
mgnify:CR=1 FL=1